MLPDMYAAILFDLDNTLIDRDAALRRALLSELGDAVVVDELMEMDASGYGDKQRFLEQWSRHAGSKKTRACVGTAIGSALEPDAVLNRRLKKLSQKTELGIVTNGTKHKAPDGNEYES